MTVVAEPETTTGEAVVEAPRSIGAAIGLDKPVGWAEQLGAMLLLAGRTMVSAVSPPFLWWKDAVQESWLILTRCMIPLMFATIMLGWSVPGIQGGHILEMFGSLDRMGAYFIMASVREFGPWVDGMVVAGVAGTAICADLGARKVRDELDALAVLGIDTTRSIVVPRFVALGLMTSLLNVISVFFGLIGGWVADVLVFGSTTSGYLNTFTSNFTMPDLIGSLVKTCLFGFIIAIVCCYKGMNVKGGAEGVGRAVNQAVVISFAAIWVFNYMFTTTLLAGFPETGNIH